MLVISFKSGEIFEEGLKTSNAIAIFGYHGLLFETPYKQIQSEYNELKEITKPFEQRPNELIKFGEKHLYCIPGDLYNDIQCELSINNILNSCTEKGITSVSFNRIRDIQKYIFGDKQAKVESDNNRVKFIVEIIENWYNKNKETTTVKLILLIAPSDFYTRNYIENIVFD
ncbi:MAG: hypothetical protein A2046_07455 [Bacteroidetes bacterium GWA2_30_7]|nr:MAG: hypothetical protein A2046_07455 [Bacteroidetes bacterium GWA2_30_7]